MSGYGSGAAARSSTAAAVLRVTSGNFFEMFDFFLFGLFAKPISDAFFPVASPAGRLLLALATFGAGHLVRPIGAIILGSYADRVGRRRGLMVTLSIMALGTSVIAFTPTWQQFARVSPPLAYLAPAIVLLGRLAQGFSAGVELGGVSVYLAEIASPDHRGFLTSWQSSSQQVAVMAGALLGFVLDRSLTPSQLAAYGWRIPFLIGCAIIPLIVILRRRLDETQAFLARPRMELRVILRTLARNSRSVVLYASLVVLTTVSFYLITIYTPTFGRQTLKLRPDQTLLVAFLVGLSNFVWLPIMGALSDRVGRKPMLLVFAGLGLATAYPVMSWLAAAPTLARMLEAEAWLSLLYAGYNGAMVVTLAEIVPPEVRTSAFSTAYSLATALFGGFTPAISQLLIQATADKAAPGLWMSVAAAVSLAGILLVVPNASSEPARRLKH